MNALTLVIPCKDEAHRLCLEDFRRALETHPYLSFLFVDDGSSDETPSRLALLARESPAVQALYLPRNVGKAEAVRQGMLWLLDNTDAEVLGFWDADLATPLDELDAFVRWLDSHPSCQAAFGTRWPHLGAQIRRTCMRRILGGIMRMLIHRVVGSAVYDTQCGAKVFRRALAYTLFRKPFISRWLFDVELIQRLPTRNPATMLAEIPLSYWRDVGDSRLDLRDALRLVPDLIRIACRSRHPGADGDPVL